MTVNLSTLPPGPTPPDAGAPDVLLADRYELGELIGAGGMGVVHRARDLCLDREVAIKLLGPGVPADSPAAARFIVEAKVTGQLQHPGIPAVHELGTLADGKPFLAMKLVQGQTLQALLEQRANPAIDLGRFVAVFEQVCYAVGYAHANRVIHRDLKPGNVMVGAHGEVQVMDWGLAKMLGDTSPTRERGDFDAGATSGLPTANVPDVTAAYQTAINTPEPEGAETRTGSVLGTPAYMAPEQAAGDIRKLDARSDVFGLGAILCKMLTGEPLYSGNDARAQRMQASRGEMNEAMARLGACAAEPELVALCRRCLALKQEERPADGTAVAAAVAGIRQAAEERARQAELDRERTLVRSAEQARRRRLALAAATVIMVALLAGLGVSLWQMQRANRERNAKAQALESERKAKDNESQERQKAEAAQQQAMDALRATTDDVVEKLLGAKLGVGPAEKEFLESTLKRWQSFAAQKGEGALARKVRAEGVFNVAFLREKLGQFEEARAGYQDAIAHYAQLAADFPAEPAHQLAQSHNNLGVLFQDLGKRAEAEEAFGRALAIREKLAADFPSVPRYRQDLAISHINLGNLLRELGKYAEAEGAYRQALAIQEKLAADFPAVPRYQQVLAGSHHNLGVLLNERGKRAEAEAACRQALAIQEKLAAEYPAVPQYLLELSRGHNSLGILLAGRGKRVEAEAAFRQAVASQDKLAAEYPAVPQYRRDLGTRHLNLGNVLFLLGKRTEAEAAYRQALAINEKLAADFPAVPAYRQELASSQNNLGALLKELDKPTEAEAAYRQALGIREKLVGECPAVPEYRQELATSHNNLGNLLTDLRKRAEAEAAYRQALALQEKLAAECPAVPMYRHELGRSHYNLGNLLRDLRKPAEAEVAYRQALGIQEKLAADYPAMPQHRRDLAASLNNLGNLLRDLRKRAEAEVAFRHALAIREKLAADYPAVPLYRQGLANSLNNLGLLFANFGQRTEADAAYRQALAIHEKLASEYPAVAGYRVELGGNQCNFGSLLRAGNQPEQALPWFDKAIATLEDVLRQANVDVTAQQFLRNAHWERARALDALMRHAEAALDWDKAIELSPAAQRASFRLQRAASRVRAGQVDTAIQEAEELAKNADANTVYDAACVLALAAGRGDEAGGSLSKEECAQRAMALLRQAIAKGFKDAEHMKKDDDLKALRQREDFQKLLAELESAAKQQGNAPKEPAAKPLKEQEPE